MRTILSITALTLALGAFALWSAFRSPNTFGTFDGAQKVEAAALIERPRDFLGRKVSVEGRITEQCKAMGCFFFIPAGNKTLRVDLEEIAMTAPRHEGGQARVEGQLIPHGDGYQLWASAIEFK
ncbi:MAG: hypothetical protein IT168_11300 [Bryobacterales bacterium]|nr:hypothetical protein [Bryobacterales bacterium]